MPRATERWLTAHTTAARRYHCAWSCTLAGGRPSREPSSGQARTRGALIQQKLPADSSFSVPTPHPLVCHLRAPPFPPKLALNWKVPPSPGRSSACALSPGTAASTTGQTESARIRRLQEGRRGGERQGAGGRVLRWRAPPPRADLCPGAPLGCQRERATCFAARSLPRPTRRPASSCCRRRPRSQLLLPPATGLAWKVTDLP